MFFKQPTTYMEAAFLTHITHKEVFVEKYMK